MVVKYWSKTIGGGFVVWDHHVHTQDLVRNFGGLIWWLFKQITNYILCNSLQS